MNNPELLEQLSCLVCSEIPQKEIFQCGEGHSICGDCVTKIAKCPLCNLEYGNTKVRNRALESLIESLKHDCPYKSRGCNAQLFLVEDINCHVKECTYQTGTYTPGTSRKGKTYDLSEWRNKDLRRNFETSTDVDFIQACWDEFHSRLLVDQEYKERVCTPNGELSGASHSSPMQRNYEPSAPVQETHRYFRTPITNSGLITGWHFTHFCGQDIVRQIETRHGEMPILMIPGRPNNVPMYQLNLDDMDRRTMQQTRISNLEFENEWEISNQRLIFCDDDQEQAPETFSTALLTTPNEGLLY